VLRKYKSAIGWQIDDLQGISPTVKAQSDNHKEGSIPQ